ncbi:MAG: SPFH domain-containing protein [Anaerolineae bacterium]
MLGNVGTLILVIIVVVVAIWLIIRLLSSSYVKTTPTAAFVRTGGLRRSQSQEPLVVVNGAAWVFGFLHRIKWVSLETMAVEIRHMDERALVTNDPQYVDLEARFFIRVSKEPAKISTAARTIGGDVVDESSVRRLAEPKIHGAVRDIAAAFSMKTLMDKRIEFIKQVQERLKEDLAENGLILESISILTLRPTLQGHYSTDDLLGAQVARASSAVIEQALTEKNKLENLGALERAQQDAEAQRERMGIEEAIETERAQRSKNITLVRSAQEAEARIMQEQKREEAERVRIMTERLLQAEVIENERQEVLLREQLQRAAEAERVAREQAIAVAEQEREKQIAEATAVKLAAVKQQIEADSLREQAMQEAMTAAEKAAAERDASIELINARLEAEKAALENRSNVEIEALRLKELAEAERAIASIQSETLRTRAQAELEAAKLQAVAERERSSATGLAEVQVALERVKVLNEEAEALRKKMLAKPTAKKQWPKRWPAAAVLRISLNWRGSTPNCKKRLKSPEPKRWAKPSAV